MKLKLSTNLEDPDAFYATLAAKLDNAEDAPAFLTRMVLLLANQIGDQAVLNAVLELAASKQVETSG